jgi:hypothetical protein
METYPDQSERANESLIIEKDNLRVSSCKF